MNRLLPGSGMPCEFMPSLSLHLAVLSHMRWSTELSDEEVTDFPGCRGYSIRHYSPLDLRILDTDTEPVFS